MDVNERPDYGYDDISIPQSIRFWLLLCFDIPAIICTCFLLYQILFKRNLRQALHNHVILILLLIALISQFIDVISYIIYARIGYVWLSIPFFCNLWDFVNIGLFNMIAGLLAWAAFERHILIFNSSLMNTQRKRLIFHYFPLCFTMTYGILFYIIMIFLPPCKNIYDYRQPWCGFPCYLHETVPATYDSIINCICPSILMIFLNITLIIRHIRQKHRVRQEIHWRTHRKMILQLLSVSLLLLTFYLPVHFIIAAHVLGLPISVGRDIELYLHFLTCFTNLLMPYVCFPSISNSWKKLFFCIIKVQTHRLHTVVPIDR